MHSSLPPSSLRSGRFTRRVFQGFCKQGIRRKLVCLALILNLLIWPAPGLATQSVPTLNAAFATVTEDTLQIGVRFLNWLFSSQDSQPQRERLADRLAHVATLQVTPFKFVGYEGETLLFNALPLHASGQTVQGVKFTWESSNPDKLQIDDTGQATLLAPGQARIICRAGAAEGQAHVLIRPGARPPQSDQQWDDDQNSFSVTGSSTTGMAPSGGTPAFASSLLDRLVPTVMAQTCPTSSDNSDFGYDELWNDPANLVGTPRHRASEPTRMGTVLPESSNFNFAIPLYGLGGRGLSASLTLYYNSRVWARHGNAVTFNPTQGWPGPGFSLGFGRIFTYGAGSSTKYVWVAPDGTRHYLGTGSDTTQSWYQTGDGSYIVFYGSKATGGSLHFNDGTKVTISVVNNRLLPTRIRDRNGNYIQITYKIYQSGYPLVPWRQALWYVSDTLGRLLEFEYDSCGNLTLIKVPGYGGTSGSPVTRNLVRFGYDTQSVSTSFSGLTVENVTGTIPTLRRVYFPDTATGYRLTYSAYVMV